MKPALGAVLGILCLGSAWASSDADLLPADGFRQAWSRAEAPRVFSGSALYDQIDGGAEIFLEFGFEALTLQRYRHGDEDEFVVEIYRLADPEAAWGIYLAKCGKETPDPSFTERHTAGRYQLTFVKNRYFVIVNNDSGKAELVPALLEFAKFVASKLEPARPPEILSSLPREGLVISSVRLIRGPCALQAIATLGPGDILQLGGKVTAVAGDYRGPAGGTQSVIVADYLGPEAARATYVHLRQNLDPLLRVVEASGDRFAFVAADGTRGVVTLTGERVTVRLLGS